MQEFCPQCAKNGQENKIKTFQVNHKEAVFMCSKEECTWPVGHQELTFISRLVGEEHSSNWEKSADAHIKTEQDRLLEFQPYTPPRTPSTFPDIMSIPPEDIILLSDDQQFPSSFIKPSNTTVSTLSSVPSNKGKSKPKVLSIQKVKNMPTSLVNKPVMIKTGKITLGPPQIRQVKIEPKETSRVLNRSKRIGHPYKRFSLNDLDKTKDQDVIEVPNSNVIMVEGAEIKVEDCLKELSTITKNVDSSNLVSTIVDTSKDNGAALDSTLSKTSIPKDLDIETIDDDVLDIDLNEIWESFSNEMEGTLKSELDDPDEYKWVNGLFEC